MKSLFWIDLEMSGLDPKAHKILEAAVVVTDFDFQTREEYHRIVYQPPEVLEEMDDWCKKTHGESGLTKAIPNGLPLEKVEEELLDLIKRHYQIGERVIICGNSVSQDRLFIDEYMKKLSEKLHYRIVDVSSFKEIFKYKYSLVYQKKNTHRALDDIYESIEELKHFLKHVQIEEKFEEAEQ